MGMFDSFFDKDNVEWQTKAFGCVLDRWDIGDPIPGPPIDYQAEVIGGPNLGCIWKYATIRGGVLASAGDERDLTLPLCLYRSGWEAAGTESNSGRQ